MMAKRGAVKPPKPYSSFPMFAHRNGSWTKTINRRHERFGRWRWPDPEAYRESWQAALQTFRRYEEAAARGEQVAKDPRSCTVQIILDTYLTEQHTRANDGRISHRTFAEQRATLTAFAKAVGKQTTVGALEADPNPIRRHIAYLDSRLGFFRLNNAMTQLGAPWRRAAKGGDNLLGGVPFKWLDLFQKRPVREFRRQRRLEREDGKRRTFAPDEVRALIDHAHQPLRAMVLLGYFCGYGASDLAELPASALTIFADDQRVRLRGAERVIPAGWGVLHFPRPKTELDRWAIVPPLVVDAIRDAQAMRPSTRASELRSRVFLTKAGTPAVVNVTKRDDCGFIKKVITFDYVAKAFRRLINRLAHCPNHGWQLQPAMQREISCSTCGAKVTPMQPRGFYGLRATAITRAAVSGASSDARNLFSGHSAGRGVRQLHYIDPSELSDLLMVADELLYTIRLPIHAGTGGDECHLTADPGSNPPVLAH